MNIRTSRPAGNPHEQTLAAASCPKESVAKVAHIGREQHDSNVFCGVADGTLTRLWDVFGPTVEFLTSPDDPGAAFCVMRGVVPPESPCHSTAATTPRTCSSSRACSRCSRMVSRGCGGVTLTPGMTCCPLAGRSPSTDSLPPLSSVNRLAWRGVRRVRCGAGWRGVSLLLIRRTRR
jgi:hypothetical protein